MSNRRSPEFPYQVSPGYERFDQKLTIFSRRIWEQKIREWNEGWLHRRAERIVADDRGYGRLDNALERGGRYLHRFNMRYPPCLVIGTFMLPLALPPPILA